MNATQTSVARKPIPFALVMGTSFIGIWWLLQPLFARLGWSGDMSRGHLLFVGAFYAIAMTWIVRSRATSASPTA
jgi:hypothetical protein